MIFKRKKSDVKDAGVLDARLYEVVRRPVVTEKSTRLSEQNKVVFEVARSASKEDVKAAVEALFKVEVMKVNTLNRMGKVRSFRGKPGRQQDSKRAMVTLKQGQSIDFAAGVR
jgi:large subunit ribosomal protein L23